MYNGRRAAESVNSGRSMDVSALVVPDVMVPPCLTVYSVQARSPVDFVVELLRNSTAEVI